MTKSDAVVAQTEMPIAPAQADGVKVMHVASETDPENLEYTLNILGDEATCTCPGWERYGRCKHATAALEGHRAYTDAEREAAESTEVLPLDPDAEEDAAPPAAM